MQKVAVVTGSSRGIGRAIALQLASDGMQIVVNYLNSEEAANQVVHKINQVTRAIAVRADVSKEADVHHLAESAFQAFGRVDVLINNAGIIAFPGGWQDITGEIWQQTLAVDLTGVFLCIREFATYFLSQKSGKIVNMASTYGILGDAEVVAYTPAKAGVINLTRGFAKQLAPYVTVNAIAPGNVDTEMTQAAGADFIQSIVESTPLKRLGTPEEIANAVSFLVSPKADFITGQVLVVDGGHMLR